VRSLHDGDGEVSLRRTHHRAAADDLAGLFLHAAGGLEELAYLRADADYHVLRLDGALARHRDDLLSYGQALVHGAADGVHRRDVEERAGPGAGSDFASGHGEDYLLLGALRVA